MRIWEKLVQKGKHAAQDQKRHHSRDHHKHHTECFCLQQILDKPVTLSRSSQRKSGKQQCRTDEHNTQIIGKTAGQRTPTGHSPNIIQRVFNLANQ